MSNRRLLLLPLYVALHALAVLVTGIVSLLTLVAAGCARASSELKVHVLWLLVMALRWTRGRPTWTADDLIRVGMQPRGARQRQVADADPRLVLVTCTCAEPTCILRRENGLYTTHERLAQAHASTGASGRVAR